MELSEQEIETLQAHREAAMARESELLSHLAEVRRTITVCNIALGITPQSSSFNRNGYRSDSAFSHVLLYGLNQPKYVLRTKGLIEWLIEQGIFPDSSAAHKSLDSQLVQRKNLLQHIARGTYQLTQEGVQRAEEIASQSSD